VAFEVNHSHQADGFGPVTLISSSSNNSRARNPAPAPFAFGVSQDLQRSMLGRKRLEIA
jgi:hypothetical protein